MKVFESLSYIPILFWPLLMALKVVEELHMCDGLWPLLRILNGCDDFTSFDGCDWCGGYDG